MSWNLWPCTGLIVREVKLSLWRSSCLPEGALSFCKAVVFETAGRSCLRNCLAHMCTFLSASDISVCTMLWARYFTNSLLQATFSFDFSRYFPEEGQQR